MYRGPYQLGPNETEINGIYQGDARLMGMVVPPNSIDVIFTDPPYPKEYLDLFGWLAGFAAHVLKPGGFLCIMTGKYHLDQVFAQLAGKGLDYYWSVDYHLIGDNTTIFPRRMVTQSKPILLYTKGAAVISEWNMQDVYKGQSKDKRYHRWGQEIGIGRYCLEFILGAESKAVVCDPFAGGGATFEACRILGLDYLGFENDPDAARTARQRVRDFVPPLFYLAPEYSQREIPLFTNTADVTNDHNMTKA